MTEAALWTAAIAGSLIAEKAACPPRSLEALGFFGFHRFDDFCATRPPACE
jgi:hypothetical protein